MGDAQIEGSTVAAVLDAAVSTFGSSFATVLERSQIWLNGEAAVREQPVGPSDEIAVIPPVSGGEGPAPETARAFRGR